MQRQMIDTYQNLMASLEELPDTMSLVQKQITDLRLQAANHERTLAQREALLLGQAEGKNAELRKAALIQLQAADRIYSTEQRLLLQVQEELSKAQDHMTTLERQYGAVCYQSRLHAALLAYLANAGAPVRKEEVQFMPAPQIKLTSHNNYAGAQVTAADAAELGL